MINNKVPEAQEVELKVNAPAPMAQEGGHGGNQWTNGIFGCFGDINACITAWLCPCVLYGRNVGRTKGTDPQGCCVYCLLMGCNLACLLGM